MSPSPTSQAVIPEYWLDQPDKLLDLIFSLDNPGNLNKKISGTGTVRHQLPGRSVLSCAPDNRCLDQPTESEMHKTTVCLLQAQIDYAHAELKSVKYHNRWLELQIAQKNDQLRLMPDLFTRAIKVTEAEYEAAALKEQVMLLQEQLQATRSEPTCKEPGPMRRLWSILFGHY